MPARVKKGSKDKVAVSDSEPKAKASKSSNDTVAIGACTILAAYAYKGADITDPVTQKRCVEAARDMLSMS